MDVPLFLRFIGRYDFYFVKFFGGAEGQNILHLICRPRTPKNACHPEQASDIQRIKIGEKSRDFSKEQFNEFNNVP